ncbi:S6e family ribosomal protein [Candidatus Nitrosotalea okcheonensis]|uniref:Small ribosomal subunit protein eS6 n=1 Tax=Candidatus Nitrosotalea okcheonensis TaxID=1903276 RepID=A0A2H1FHF6_9ARCH|nr:S6e family ribosomal protein [Candidatus Nitrosotalea okcheonensis]MDE1727942.1 30S ribosomal protein S6e [Nitrososphaerota archaeon]MDE1832605.1 30S ribosomal protein S6e [Nitrososphaerota archaeon]SMH72174.1 30S ribosomal protein S6e [Candidatus Nitrosotalea okcheonensis]
MATFKLNISDKKGRTITKEVKEKEAGPFLGVTVGTELDAALIGEAGKLKITGGSDKSGVPLRADIHGGARKYILLSQGIGLRDAENGQRIRKLVRGNTVTEEVYQLNCSFDGELKIEEKPAEESAEKKA